MANCQNCVDVPAVWPSSVPHLCSKCHSKLDIMRQGLERNNYSVALSKAGDKKKVRLGGGDGLMSIVTQEVK